MSLLDGVLHTKVWKNYQAPYYQKLCENVVPTKSACLHSNKKYEAWFHQIDRLKRIKNLSFFYLTLSNRLLKNCWSFLFVKLF